MSIYKLSATQMAEKLRNKEISAVEIAQDSIQRISQTDNEINAFLSVTPEKALENAKIVDEKIAKGEELSPLAGIPIAIKDNICTKDINTTCASKMLENFNPPYNATVVEKILDQNSTIVGKVNLDEFAMGGSCENSYFKTTKNPWDTSCVPGGSSGGSAAAVAASQVPLSLGSDTGGSVRCPASYCGIVGLKPTYGAVSRYGLVAFASSLDQIGPMARTVQDTEMLFKAICGADKTKDATSRDYTYTSCEANLKGKKLGIPKEYFGNGVSPQVKTAVYNAVKVLENLGAEIIEVSLPSTDYALAAYYIISSAEASSNLARYDGVKYGFSTGREGTLTDMYELTRSEGFGAEVKRRIMLGTYVLSSGYYDAYYKRAKLLQKQISAEFSQAFEKCDALITPVCPTTAFKIGEKTKNPLEMYASDICTVTVNIGGLPALSVPCGFDENNMPIGMQIIGDKFTEANLLAIGKAYETAQGGFKIKEL